MNEKRRNRQNARGNRADRQAPDVEREEADDAENDAVSDLPDEQTRRPPAIPPSDVGRVPLPSWPDAAQHAQVLVDMRRRRARRFLLRVLLFVGVPTALVTIYCFLIATPRYVSDFEITYQTYQAPTTLSTGLVQSMFGSSVGSNIDLGAILYEYVRSETMLRKLDEKLNLRAYYSNPDVDWPTRLRANASQEQFLDYYHWHIVDVAEGLGGYDTISITAFDDKFAFQIAQAIVQACDEMIDQMTARARNDEVKYAEEELKRQEDRVRAARLAETKFQNEHGDINPPTTATQFGQIVANIEGDLAKARTELANTLSFAKPDAPQVTQLKQRIAALEEQLKDQRARLAGNGNGDANYAKLLEQYQALQLEQQFAQNAYLAAQQGVTVARADAARKQNYLVDFVTPSQSTRPTRWFAITWIATTFLGSLFLFGVGSLIVGAFRDQSGM